MDPGSRLFVSLAEEYRKLGRFRQALSALQKGLLAHPGYIAAQVALGRVYLEVGQSTDAIATFTKVLVADPGNLVAAKSLADVQLSRGDKLEALKKYKLYRALSGDRKVDELIVGLEGEVAPRPVTPSRVVAKPEPPPPPPSFQETDKNRRRPSLERLPRGPRLSDAFDITSVSFEPGEDSHPTAGDEPFPFVPTRDTALTGVARATAQPAAPPAAEPASGSNEAAPAAEAAPRDPDAGAPAPEAAAPTVPASAAAVPDAPPVPAPEGTPPALFQPADDAAFGEAPKLFQEREESSTGEPSEESEPPAPSQASAQAPTGRALADLYYSQGHYAEALQIYDDLVARHPFDDELMRMRRDAEARLLPASRVAGAPEPDPGIERGGPEFGPWNTGFPSFRRDESGPPTVTSSGAL